MRPSTDSRWALRSVVNRALTTIVKDTSGHYEVVVLSPSHFSPDRSPMLIVHPLTKQPTFVYADEGGALRGGSTTGPIPPPFRSRGPLEHEVPLNPILVNFAAILRLRRVFRQKPD